MAINLDKDNATVFMPNVSILAIVNLDLYLFSNLIGL